MIEREMYLEQLKKLKDKQIIKVITGIRRCGKSTLLEIFKNHLLENNVIEEQIISINFEDADYDKLKDCNVLHDYLKERLVPNKMTYIFL